jgi:SagB-type dehydrogenase family enzyme
MEATTAIAFRDDVRVAFDDDSVSLASPVSTFTLRPVRPGFRTALGALATGGASVPDLLSGLEPVARAQFGKFLDRAGHLIVRSVSVPGRELVRVEHTARDAVYEPVELPVGVLARLSKFAFCRSRSDVLVLESPLAKVRVLLLDRAARGLVTALGAPRTVAELSQDDLPESAVRELLGQLAGAGFVDLGTPDDGFAADADPELRQWDFHDLLFHSRVRSGRYDDPIGGRYPHRGRIEPQPAVKSPPEGPSIELYRPSLDDVVAHEPGLTAAIEGRRSIRQYGEQPLTVRELGEFLYRVARVRVHFRPDQAPAGGVDEIVGKPYPTGGSAYELELYLTVRRCAGLAPGIYYHDPVGHRLVLVNTDPADRAAMLHEASRSTGMEADPDLLITMTSRFQRLSWKYSGIAYAMTLRHTGVLYQTMYLVATAMGLAPCGLGIGNADLSARAFGLDYLRESSVGDFLLGNRPSGELGMWREDQGWQMVNDPSWAVWATDVLRRLPT